MLTLLGLVLAVVGCAPATVHQAGVGRARLHLVPHQAFLGARLDKVTKVMSESARDLAARHMPGRRLDLWGRPTGWAVLDLSQPPALGFMLDPTPDIAEGINALRPFSTLPIRPLGPFVLAASADDSARAMTCLTEAVYYEAGMEPKVGQEAIAQVVLNRLRHPAYPKSICGVVYQGAARTTGCQFTFTCDGSLNRPLNLQVWHEAETVARQALGGHVVKEVGTATHYHASYVVPYWAPTLVKMVKLGQHIFYRWTGPGGEPTAFNGRYEGVEAFVSPAILSSLDARTQGMFANPSEIAKGMPSRREVTLGLAGDTRTYQIAEPMAGLATPLDVQGALTPSRRQPTKDEVQQINAALAKLEKDEAESTSSSAPQP